MAGSRACKHWESFKCNVGDACRFSHDGPGGPSPLGTYPGFEQQHGGVDMSGGLQGHRQAQPQDDVHALMAMGYDAETLASMGIHEAKGTRSGKPCAHWEQHKCNFGDACKFSHDGPGGPGSKGVYPGIAQGPPPQQWAPPAMMMSGPPSRRPPRPCAHWEQFKCNFGDACSFSHAGPGGPSSKGVFPGIEQPQATVMWQQPMPQWDAGWEGAAAPQGSSVCKHFLAGKCNVERCRFSHEVYAPPAYTPPAPVGSVCKHFLAGKCNVERCRFSHEVYAPQGGGGGGGGGSMTSMCKHFLAGKCNVERCKFSHETNAPGAGVSPLGPYDVKGSAYGGKGMDPYGGKGGGIHLGKGMPYHGKGDPYAGKGYGKAGLDAKGKGRWTWSPY